ncbi:uncharacterized protein J7T55_007560 [Diaporthe amygdali]|uniref:uncharacterized protein n=1 Tax=Phomopsis amygdali TaxID=1214568 RepID=UPI0022FE5274|nr:uncharacterized protein J7T55_007560 [Diaporthe amygdali]KAJ0107190.1 uncharacterized protein J7T55_007560 [Diaporthe amygdali]
MFLPLQLLLAFQARAHIVPPTSANTSPVGIVSKDIAGADALDEVVAAMGGVEALNKIDSFTYHANDIYRSATLTQTYNLYSLDQSVASAGSQIISFEGNGTMLKSRIDRAYIYNEYWTWAFPDLQPGVNMSLIVRDDADQYACFVQGQNNFFSPNLTFAQGYADAYLTDYLIHQTHQFAIPWMVQRFMSDKAKVQAYEVWDPYSSAMYIAITHGQLNLTILVDNTTNLPHAIRSTEDHQIYGPSTSDLVLTGYSNVSIGDDAYFALPHRLQTIYNSRYVLEDILVDTITINDRYPDSFFDGRAPLPNPEDQSQSGGMTPAKPIQSPEYPRSEVHEFFETGLWGGPFGDFFNATDVVVEYPDPTFTKIMYIYVGFPDYVQLLVEHTDGFIITDAPAHRSTIILEWLQQFRPDKIITHVVPSHHHRDHAGGVGDYVGAGATLVVPKVAKDFYNQTGQQLKIALYDAENPFVLRDDEVEFRSFWKENNPHAEDWSFAVATRAQPKDGDVFALFNADVVNPGTEALRWDTGSARDFLIEAVRANVPRSAILVGAHGSTNNATSTCQALVEIARIVGFDYPSLNSADWVRAQ